MLIERVNIRTRKILAMALVVGAMLASASTAAQIGYSNSMNRIPEPGVWVAQNSERDDFRTKSEVMRDVKRRYQARVLKIKLVESRGIYRVRLLMPNGKVRNISVSARR